MLRNASRRTNVGKGDARTSLGYRSGTERLSMRHGTEWVRGSGSNPVLTRSTHNPSAVRHRFAVKRILNSIASLQPILLQHRTECDRDAVAVARAGCFDVGHDRVTERTKCSARRL